MYPERTDDAFHVICTRSSYLGVYVVFVAASSTASALARTRSYDSQCLVLVWIEPQLTVNQIPTIHHTPAAYVLLLP